MYNVFRDRQRHELASRDRATPTRDGAARGAETGRTGEGETRGSGREDPLASPRETCEVSDPIRVHSHRAQSAVCILYVSRTRWRGQAARNGARAAGVLASTLEVPRFQPASRWLQTQLPPSGCVVWVTRVCPRFVSGFPPTSCVLCCPECGLESTSAVFFCKGLFWKRQRPLF